MDEPTSVLTPQEVERLFLTLRQLAAEGCSILYISHKLQEIQALCDGATILRGGKVVATCDPKAETAKSMAQLMIGAEIRTLSRRKSGTAGKPRLAVRNLHLEATARSAPRCGTSRSRSGRASCSASPGSPATARTSSSRRSRASGWSPAPT